MLSFFLVHKPGGYALEKKIMRLQVKQEILEILEKNQETWKDFFIIRKKYY